MKDFVSVRNSETKTKKHVQKRLVLSNLKEAFAKFKNDYPVNNIGFSMFASLRPKHCVLAGTSGTHTVFVCALHQNVKLMMIGKFFCFFSIKIKEYNFTFLHYSDCLQLITCHNWTHYLTNLG